MNTASVLPFLQEDQDENHEPALHGSCWPISFILTTYLTLTHCSNMTLLTTAPCWFSRKSNMGLTSKPTEAPVFRETEEGLLFLTPKATHLLNHQPHLFSSAQLPVRNLSLSLSGVEKGIPLSDADHWLSKLLPPDKASPAVPEKVPKYIL